MKGITPVIAIILLIMITISMVSFMFVWFTDFLSKLTGQTEKQLTEQQRRMQMKISFIGADKGAGGNIFVSLRNTGTVDIRAGELVIFVRNSTSMIGDPYTYSSSIAPGGTVTDEDIGVACPAETDELEIKADLPGTNDDTIPLICS